jgi:hypothetical protein
MAIAAVNALIVLDFSGGEIGISKAVVSVVFQIKSPRDAAPGPSALRKDMAGARSRNKRCRFALKRAQISGQTQILLS